MCKYESLRFMEIEKLAVVIPVYNEADTISAAVRNWITVLKMISSGQSSLRYKLFLYNSGSTDATSYKLEELENEFPDEIRFFNETRVGHGPAVLKGCKLAAAENYDWIFQADSDRAVSADLFPALWKQRMGFDLLAGERNERSQTLIRKIMSWCFRQTVNLAYGKSIRDVNSPYRLMKVAAVRDILSRIPEDSCAPGAIISGMAARKKLRCCEIPVPQQKGKTASVSTNKLRLLDAAVKSFSETLEFSLEGKKSGTLFFAAAAVSLLAKLILAGNGWNFDYESYKIVVGIMRNGGNVYAETTRYNYGPVWFHILWFLSIVSGPFFRYAVPLFLGLADIGIAGFLWKRFHYRIAAILFLLSPLSIQITGYHNQFDNVAVFLTLWAVAILSENKSPSTQQVVSASVITGIALATKHVFIFFIFWYLFRQYDWKKKILLTVIPLAIFGAGFIPYIYPWNTATYKNIKQDAGFVKEQIAVFKKNNMTFSDKQKEEIRNYAGNLRPTIGCLINVFYYKSFNNCILYTYYIPRVFQMFCHPFFLFLAGLLFSGWLCRKCELFDAFTFYTVSLLLFTTATTNQYLVIPSIFTSIHFLPFGLLYNCVPGLYLIWDPNGALMHYGYVFCTGLLLLMYFDFIRKRKTGI